jgi:AraC-like DNA-binding protein
MLRDDELQERTLKNMRFVARNDGTKHTDQEGRRISDIAIVSNHAAVPEELTGLSNLYVHALKENDTLAARIALFPEVTFCHATLPNAVLEWKRDETEQFMATMVFRIKGDVAINAENDDILRRTPDIMLVPAGCANVSFQAKAPTNELIVITMKKRLFSTILPDYKTFSLMTQNAPFDTSALQPLLAFVVSACNLNNPRSQVADMLENVADEVSRALLVSCFCQGMTTMPLIERVRKYIAANYMDSSLSVTKTAKHEGVSIRTLQLALQENDTNFTNLVRRARTDAALELRVSQPTLTLVEVADRCGFGSVSSLRRALKTSDGEQE